VTLIEEPLDRLAELLDPERLDPRLAHLRHELETGLPDQIDTILAGLAPRRPCGSYLRHGPWPKQRAFLLMNTEDEVFYGGAGGGGKSDALLMGALQYVCVPGYAAILMRQTSPQLHGEDGLVPRSEDWLAGTDAVWSKSELQWEFPSGAALRFGHAEYDQDRFKHSGHAYQYVGLDELPNWRTPKVYLYVGFARRRRPSNVMRLPACPGCGLTLADVPLRTRATGNPGGPGHTWVRRRFGIQLPGGCPPGRRFVPASLADNPALDRRGYAEGLMHLDPVERAQILAGDWTVREGGRMFRREWFTGGFA